jgi:hypothetical protein
MKKIITIILLSTLSLSALSQGTFNMTIPQPDFVSNDWDGDGIINSEDTDDDGDGIDDLDDSTPFGGSPGGSGTSVDNSKYTLTWSSNAVPEAVFPNGYEVYNQSMYVSNLSNNLVYAKNMSLSLSKDGIKITDNSSPLYGVIINGVFNPISSRTNTQGNYYIDITKAASFGENSEMTFVFEENVDSLTDVYSLPVMANTYMTSNSGSSAQVGVYDHDNQDTYNFYSGTPGYFVNGNSIANGVLMESILSYTQSKASYIGFKDNYNESKFIGVKIDGTFFSHTHFNGYKFFTFEKKIMFPNYNQETDVEYYFVK